IASTVSAREVTLRLKSVDVLRALAALTVLAYHTRAVFWVGVAEMYQKYGLQLNFNALLGYMTLPFKFGYLGVELFFVLSGYCIHRRGARLLANVEGAKLELRDYALRRLWRIYPTYLVAMIFSGLADLWI